MTTLNAKTSFKTYRYKFSKGFLETLKEFTRNNNFDEARCLKKILMIGKKIIQN